MTTTAAWWAEQVSAWRRSGLTGREYALAAEVSEGSLRQWKSRLAKRAAAPSGRTRSSGFVEVVLGEGEAGHVANAAMLELLLPRGMRVRVPAGFDSIALQRLLQVLEGR